MPTAADRSPTTVTVALAVADPVPVLTATPAPMVAPVAAVSPAPAEADGLDDADGRDGSRWRPSVLAGSVAVFAVVSLLTAAWAHQRRNDDAAPVAASVTALAGAATTASPAPTSDPAATSEATTAPAPTVPATTVPAPTLPAPTVPASTSAVPPTGAPATTVATVASTAPAPTTPASVRGTAVLNRELLDALGKGVLPTGQPWPRATFNNGKLVLTGAVPSPEAAAAMVATAGALATPDLVVNELVTDASAAPARYLLVRLFDTAVFDRGSTTLRKDSDVLIELWGKRLRDQPSATLVLVAHGDGTGTALAATRSKNALARVLATGGVAPEQVDAQWSAGAATGPRLDFAVPVS